MEERKLAEAVDFFERLESMNSDEIGFPLVAMLGAAKISEEEYNVDVYDPFVAMSVVPDLDEFYVSLALQLQSANRHALAPGPMIWVHTLRAVSDHKIRNVTRQIWQELSRGVSFVEDSRNVLFAEYEIWPELDKAAVVPKGMEPKK